MIVTDRQLAHAKAQAERFRAALAALDAGSLNSTDLDPRLKAAQIDSVRTDLTILETEIAEFERLRDGAVRSFDTDSLADLPKVLIQARIAAGLTQRQLADRLSLKEQQIQRYEATLYDGASFSRMVDVADAIGLAVNKRLELIEPGDPQAVVKRLSAIGLDEGFLKRRVTRDLDLGRDRESLGVMASRVGAIFDWAPRDILGPGALDPSQLGGATARFKMPKGRDARSASIYAAYAYHLATLCAKAMADRPRSTIPTEWHVFRNALVHQHGGVDFRACLDMAWDLGVVVLPLNDPGAFHGACWRINHVNVVVLKQAHRYPARWLFDLIHELRHAADHPEAAEFEVVEGEETSDERRTSHDEQLCSWFAGQVTLDGKAESLVEAAIAHADGDLRRLKTAVTAVADRFGADVSALANYAAHRLSLQKVNWWGVAANMQDTSYDPLVFARDVFFQRFAFESLGERELDLLTLALHDEAADG
ncbi:helix-turn-helix domain-containing protein [Caulobacter sp. KR2-114]|uniref:helix-turn-helix domain-containing protein n=1 Tax=Caulobacter sp. KR2-114 TaxID=3400912 RepID=UPI003C1282F2